MNPKDTDDGINEAAWDRAMVGRGRKRGRPLTTPDNPELIARKVIVSRRVWERVTTFVLARGTEETDSAAEAAGALIEVGLDALLAPVDLPDARKRAAPGRLLCAAEYQENGVRLLCTRERNHERNGEHRPHGPGVRM